jgi:hypothetical protein
MLGLLAIGTPRPVMPATKVASNRQPREKSLPIAAGQNSGTFNIRSGGVDSLKAWLQHAGKT